VVRDFQKVTLKMEAWEHDAFNPHSGRGKNKRYATPPTGSTAPDIVTFPAITVSFGTN
jgi:hypothetical protein